jgi:hypothetical protein
VEGIIPCKEGGNNGPETSFCVELDSNADTCCFGGGVMVVSKTDRQVSLTLFNKSLGTLHKVPIITAAIAYDDPKSGKVFILIIHQAFFRTWIYVFSVQCK